MTIEQIYQLANAKGLVKSRIDFCDHWVGVRSAWLVPHKKNKTPVKGDRIVALALACERHGMHDVAQHLRERLIRGDKIYRHAP